MVLGKKPLPVEGGEKGQVLFFNKPQQPFRLFASSKAQPGDHHGPSATLKRFGNLTEDRLSNFPGHGAHFVFLGTFGGLIQGNVFR